MAEAITIAAEVRERAGKGAARATRRAGRVPAVIYGTSMEPALISLDTVELRQHLAKTGFFSQVFEVSENGRTHRVLARDVQYDPVTDRPIHVDFLRFGAETRLNVEVEVMFENEDESPGIKRGGVLNVVRHTIELTCPADSVPPFLTVDLTGLDIGDSLHISAVELPEGVSPTVTDRDFTIATIAAPTLMPLEEEEKEAEEVEGEEGEEAVEGEAEGEPKAEEKDAKE